MRQKWVDAKKVGIAVRVVRSLIVLIIMDYGAIDLYLEVFHALEFCQCWPGSANMYMGLNGIKNFAGNGITQKYNNRVITVGRKNMRYGS